VSARGLAAGADWAGGLARDRFSGAGPCATAARPARPPGLVEAECTASSTGWANVAGPSRALRRRRRGRLGNSACDQGAEGSAMMVPGPGAAGSRGEGDGGRSRSRGRVAAKGATPSSASGAGCVGFSRLGQRPSGERGPPGSGGSGAVMEPASGCASSLRAGSPHGGFGEERPGGLDRAWVAPASRGVVRGAAACGLQSWGGVVPSRDGCASAMPMGGCAGPAPCACPTP
jgi:hypothetical protein